jgi:CheY-like chemotaxis protein
MSFRYQGGEKDNAMKDGAELVTAVAGLVWPLIVVVVILRLLPTIKTVVGSRGLTVKIGGVELTLQQVSEKLVASTADMQEKLASVQTATSSVGVQGIESSGLVRRVLWVDDRPSNNAYEIAQLQALGVDVVKATSTQDAFAALRGEAEPFDAVISDMGRFEDGENNPDAGLDLVRALRKEGNSVPTFIYTSPGGMKRHEEMLAAGANGVASASTMLFQLFRRVGRFPNKAAA